MRGRDGGITWGCTVLLASLLAVAGCRANSLPSSEASTPIVAPVSSPPLEPSQVARGRRVYLQHCAGCHGQNAEGAPNWSQPDAQGNLPPPPHDDSGHSWRHGDAELAAIIRNGWRDPFNKTAELTMPAFKDRLSDEEIAAVVAYFKSLWSSEHREFQEEQNHDTRARN